MAVAAAVGVAAWLIIRKKRKDNAQDKLSAHVDELASGKATTSVVDNKDNTGKVKSAIYPVEYGDRGTIVSLLQEALNVVYGAGLEVDGIFGKKTKAALQQYMGVDTVERETGMALFEKYRQVKANESKK